MTVHPSKQALAASFIDEAVSRVSTRRQCLRHLGSAVPAWLLGAHGAALAQPMQDNLPALVASAKRAVLPVGTYSVTDNPRFAFRGSGFVIGDGNLVVTNAHVVAATPPNPLGAGFAASAPGPALPARPGLPPTLQNHLLDAPLAVLLARGGDTAEVRLARVLVTDRLRDLAVLRIEGAPLPNPMQLDASGGAREGQSIALMGYPIGGTLGFATVTHRGSISSITTMALPAATSGQLDARAVARLREGNFEVLQLDANAYPGNSGGPVLDTASGRVLGVVSMVLVKGTRESALAQPTGITYAIPVRQLRALLEEQRISVR